MIILICKGLVKLNTHMCLPLALEHFLHCLVSFFNITIITAKDYHDLKFARRKSDTLNTL